MGLVFARGGRGECAQGRLRFLPDMALVHPRGAPSPRSPRAHMRTSVSNRLHTCEYQIYQSHARATVQASKPPPVHEGHAFPLCFLKITSWQYSFGCPSGLLQNPRGGVVVIRVDRATSPHEAPRCSPCARGSHVA